MQTHRIKSGRLLLILIIILFVFIANLDISNASLLRKLVAEGGEGGRGAPSSSSSSNNNHTSPHASAATTTHIAPSPSAVVGNNSLDPQADVEAPQSPQNSSGFRSNVSNNDPPLSRNDTNIDARGSENAVPPSSNQMDTGNAEAKSSNHTITSSVNSPTVNHTGDQKNDERVKETDGAKGSNETLVSSVNPPAESQRNGDRGDGKPKKEDDQTDSQVLEGQTCEGFVNRCNDQNALVACVQSFDTGSKELVVLVQNEGDDELKVNFPGLPTGYRMRELVLSKHQTKKINISLGESTKVVLNAGNGDCVLLQVGAPVSAGNFFVNLPSYDQLVTPINGAYLLMVSVLILGGTWACCKFRKRRRHGGTPYQELEMGMPESNSVNNVETAEGWDEDWDDDWDEENAVKSPGGHISANGLTSRTTNRDGWENDWDD